MSSSTQTSSTSLPTRDGVQLHPNNPVTVQSTVAVDSQAKAGHIQQSNLSSLIDSLRGTHLQLDQHISQRQMAITEWGQSEITKILQNMQLQQDALVKNAESQVAGLDKRYAARMEELVRQADREKGVEIKSLEDKLKEEQTIMLTAAKKAINDIEDQMNRRKAEVIVEANKSNLANIDQLTNLVANTKLRPSTTTTVIKTQTNTGTITAQALGGGEHEHVKLVTERVITGAPVVAAPATTAHLEQGTTNRGTAMTMSNSANVVDSCHVGTTTTVVKEDGAALQQNKAVGGPSDPLYGKDPMHTVAASRTTSVAGEPKSTNIVKP